MLLVQCPACGKEAASHQSPGRYFGKGKQWSDGYWSHFDPMACWLASCPDCRHTFWFDSAISKRGTPRFLFIVPFSKAQLPENDVSSNDPELIPATNEAIIEALSADISEERERHLRTVLWYRSNHPDRDIAIGFGMPISRPVRNDNLRWLLSDFQSRPNENRDEVIEAELLRELGEFDAALKRMEMAVCSGSTRALAIHAEVIARNTSVCVVREDESAVIY